MGNQYVVSLWQLNTTGIHNHHPMNMGGHLGEGSNFALNAVLSCHTTISVELRLLADSVEKVPLTSFRRVVSLV